MKFKDKVKVTNEFSNYCNEIGKVINVEENYLDIGFEDFAVHSFAHEEIELFEPKPFTLFDLKPKMTVTLRNGYECIFWNNTLLHDEDWSRDLGHYYKNMKYTSGDIHDFDIMQVKQDDEVLFDRVEKKCHYLIKFEENGQVIATIFDKDYLSEIVDGFSKWTSVVVERIEVVEDEI